MKLLAVEPLATWKVVTLLVAVPLLVAYCLVRRRNDLRIVALCVVSVTLYGMIQDQLSARMAPEFFTVARPPIAGLSDPRLLALAWGVLWSWGGLLIGLAAGLTATLGKRPPLTARELAPAVGCLLLGVAFVTLVCGAAAYYNGRLTGARLAGLSETLSPQRQWLFLAVACAHCGTYAAVAAGGVALCVWVAWRRAKALSDASGRATS